MAIAPSPEQVIYRDVLTFFNKPSFNNLHALSERVPESFDEMEQSRVRESFKYNPLTGEYPEWLPVWFQSVWAFLILAIIMSLVFTLIVLGEESVMKKWSRWTEWYEDNWNIRQGLLLPQFPVNVLNGMFSVVGPIFIVRELDLDISLLAALVFAEHAVQVLTQQLCGKFVDTDGHKPAQRRAVQLLTVTVIIFAFIPLAPSHWIASAPWLFFFWYMLARLVYAWGTNQFDANYNAAINNSAFLPPQDATIALDIFYFSNMLGSFVGALLTLLVVVYLPSRWALILGIPLIAAMHFLVENIRQDEHHVTFPPDPEALASDNPHPAWASSRRLLPGGPGVAAADHKASKFQAFVRGSSIKPWVYDIWLNPEARSLLVHFIVIMLLFSSLQATFTFLLPLGGMGLGLTDEDVAFLVAVPSIVGIFLFWLGSAFDHISYVSKGILAATGFAVAYFTGWLMEGLPGLFAAAYVFGIVACYSCDLVLLLRICYLHAVSRHRGSKNEFSNAQEYASHLIAFNAPIAALIVDLSTVWTAFMVWAGLSLLAVVWISLVARRRS